MGVGKILIHTCCAPCLVAPYFNLVKSGFEVYAFWYNHNIHPYQEYVKRLQALQDFAEEENIKTIYKDEYNFAEFLRKVVFREHDRCRICYYDRLKYAAVVAKQGNFDYFTSTLLYSKLQQHELVRDIGESLGKEYGLKFLYKDFRKLWKEGIELSHNYKMYRQQYCGCIYSEYERYTGKKDY